LRPKYYLFEGPYVHHAVIGELSLYSSGTCVQATFSGMPETIYPNKPVSLKFSFVPTENSTVKLSFTSSAGADFDQWDLGQEGRTRESVGFVNKEDKSSFVITSDVDPSYEETLTAVIGGGTENSRIALRLKFSMGIHGDKLYL
jgi:hypothetical protein